MNRKRCARTPRCESHGASTRSITTQKSKEYHGVMKTRIFGTFKSKFTLRKKRELKPSFCDRINRTEISRS
jgi:hypothetical protein